jgi:hypothetical protein
MYTTLISALSKRDTPESLQLMQNYMTEMTSQNITPSVATYKALITACAKVRRLWRDDWVSPLMRSFGWCRLLLFLQYNMIDEMMAHFSDMQARKVVPDSAIYDCIAQALERYVGL